MSNVEEINEQVSKIWANYIFSDLVLTSLVAPVHGDSLGAPGATWLGTGIYHYG